MIYIALHPKINSVRFQSPTMASDAKRYRYSVAKALKTIFDDGSERGGMSGGEESELDRKLENPSEESKNRYIFECKVIYIVIKHDLKRRSK